MDKHTIIIKPKESPTKCWLVVIDIVVPTKFRSGTYPKDNFARDGRFIRQLPASLHFVLCRILVKLIFWAHGRGQLVSRETQRLQSWMSRKLWTPATKNVNLGSVKPQSMSAGDLVAYEAISLSLKSALLTGRAKIQRAYRKDVQSADRNMCQRSNLAPCNKKSIFILLWASMSARRSWVLACEASAMWKPLIQSSEHVGPVLSQILSNHFDLSPAPSPCRIINLAGKLR